MPKKRRRRKAAARPMPAPRSPFWRTVGILSAGIAIVAAVVWGVNRPSAGPKPASSEQPGDVQRIALDQARTLVSQGEAILYDVRSTDSYRKSHAKGAISLPENDFASLIGTVPEGKGLVLY